MPPLKWKLDLSISNYEINDLRIALERKKELENQVAQNAAANITNAKLLGDLSGLEMKSFSYGFLTFSWNWSNHTYT